MNIPGKGKYMLEADSLEQPELPTAASVVGAAIYRAAGFNTPCAQIVYFKPSLLKLTPGLRWRHSNLEDESNFDDSALQQVLKSSARRGPLVRMHASAWIPGHLLQVMDEGSLAGHEKLRKLRQVVCHQLDLDDEQRVERCVP